MTATTTNYIQHAMRTNSDTVGTYNVHPDLIHGALGLADELIELRAAMDKCDRTNALEELSDILWFVALIAQSLDDCNPFYDDANRIGDAFHDWNKELYDWCGHAISAIKRSYAYGKPLDIDLGDYLCCIIDSIANIAFQLGSSLSAVLELNINKLSNRYPDRFTPEQANNRDTERERSVLEQNT